MASSGVLDLASLSNAQMTPELLAFMRKAIAEAEATKEPAAASGYKEGDGERKRIKKDSPIELSLIHI